MAKKKKKKKDDDRLFRKICRDVLLLYIRSELKTPAVVRCGRTPG
jgi:hypothetical protein